MAKAFDFPIDIDPSFYAAIGEVTARWAWLEHRLAVLMRVGFRMDKGAGRALIATMKAEPLSRAAVTLTTGKWIKDKTVRAKVRSFRDEFDRLRKERNDFAHGVYGTEPGASDTTYRIQMRGVQHIIEPNGEAISVNKLAALAKEMRDLQVIGLALTDELKASQRK